jgi:hypothetical protein
MEFNAKTWKIIGSVAGGIGLALISYLTGKNAGRKDSANPVVQKATHILLRKYREENITQDTKNQLFEAILSLDELIE